MAQLLPVLFLVRITDASSLSATFQRLGDTCQANGTRGYISCSTTYGMETSSASDIVFACTHCATSYVVAAAAAGVTLQCQRCGQQTTVPSSELTTAAANAVRISELQHHLKENEAQRTEIRSYINQHSIQLHRWQLRLKDLNERQQKIEAEMAALCKPSDLNAATR